VAGSMNRERLMQGMAQHTPSGLQQEMVPINPQQEGLQGNGQPMYQSLKTRPLYNDL